MALTSNSFCEIHCKSASEMLHELDETHARWKGDTWIFRGQNDVSWGLHPSAMREDSLIEKHVSQNLDKYLDEFIPDMELARQIFDTQFGPYKKQVVFRGRTLEDIVLADIEQFRRNVVARILHVMKEMLLVAAFEQLADRAGLEVPIDRFSSVWNRPLRIADLFRHMIENGLSVSTIDPTRIVYALAQHHRVPTRLLDWTYRPHVAAFFAAYNFGVDELVQPACRQPEFWSEEPEPNSIVVWAINQRVVRSKGLQVVRHHRSQIGFLRSQDGVFVYDVHADKNFMVMGQWLPFNYHLTDLPKSESAYQLTLPYSERQELLELLNKKRISKPNLMPSFDNVADEINMMTDEQIERLIE